MPRSKSAAVVLRTRSRGPPSASSTVSRDAPKPVCARSFAKRGRPVAVGGQGQNARAGLQMRADEIERAAVQRQQHRLRQRPAEPRRGEAEGRRRRHHDHLARIDRAAPAPRRRRSGTDRRTPARRPGGRDGCSTSSAAPSNGLGHGRAAPRMSGAARPRCRRPPNTISAAPISPRAAGAQALDAILADADDGQPARRCGSVARDRLRKRHAHASLFSAAPTEARLLAERLAGRAGLDVTLSLAGRTASPARQPVPVRVGGFGGAAGLADYLAARAHRRADRRHASVCERHFGQRRRGRAQNHRAVRGAAPAAVDRGRRRPLDRGRATSREAVRAIGQRRAASSSRSAATSSRLSPDAPQHSYLIRSVDPVDPPLPLPHVTYITARGPFSEADDRALMTRARSTSSSPRTAAAAPPTARSPQRARSASR